MMPSVVTVIWQHLRLAWIQKMAVIQQRLKNDQTTHKNRMKVLIWKISAIDLWLSEQLVSSW